MLDQKIHNGTQTGWVKWEFAKVTLESPRLLSCEASLENLSKNSPACIVLVRLEGETRELIQFKFWIAPEKKENVKLQRTLSESYTGISSVDVDEQ